MKPSLCYTYCTLLLVSLVSSCTLFIIVASETLKPTTGGQVLQPHGATSGGGSLVQHSVRNDLVTAGDGEGDAENRFRPEEVIPGDGGPTVRNVRPRGTKPDNGLEREVVRSDGDATPKPLKRPPSAKGAKNSLRKDILTEKPAGGTQPDEPPDLKDVIFLETISKNVGVTNSGLQDIPGPSSIITLVDHQHHELNKIESKLEENLEATLKNLSHNNVHTGVQPATPLPDDDQQHHRLQQLSTVDGASDGEEHHNETIELEGGVETSSTQPETIEQPILVMVPTDDGGSAPTRPHASDAPAVPEPSGGERDLKPPVNLTEENPMPVFSEWAQKQMAEAEKKLGEVVNASAMRKGTKPANGKVGGGTMKLRAKNYAAPECGAKIIASNPEAQSTGSVLTAPKDEYLLNPCTSKIWFVVELCEPVQAERIELANFELFSSSPKEFTVSVSNRFPTRDWANVGQFTAKDERDVQSFELHPHLFGKFVRVEILSHYNQEHFCPVSLFRVYGTSEFEAFETDNTPLPPDDDDEEDDLTLEGLDGEDREMLLAAKRRLSEMREAGISDETLVALQKEGEGGSLEKTEPDTTVGGRRVGKNPNNILKSAGEVVMNMVKKAAEALGKSGNDSGKDARSTDTLVEAILPTSCVTLAYTIRCVNCTDRFRARLEPVMNCRHNLLTSLLGVARIERSFDSAQHFLCANVLGFNLPRSTQGGGDGDGDAAVCLNMRYSVLNLLPDELVAGLCNMVAYDLKLLPTTKHAAEEDEQQEPDVVEIHVDAAADHDHLPELQSVEQVPSAVDHVGDSSTLQHQSEDTGRATDEMEQKDVVSPEEPSKEDVAHSGQPSPTGTMAGKEDVNMFNIPTESSLVVESDGVEASHSATSTAGQDQQQEQREKYDLANSHTWEAIEDGMLASTGAGHHQSDVPSGAGGSTTGPSASTAPGIPTGPQKVQPESVFLRLSNRIKALERNMSLSGQYLEELSRRYRKQVEELQHSYAKTLHEIEEQNRRMRDSEAALREVNDRLRLDLIEFQATVGDWRNIVLAVLIVVILLFLILLVLVRSVATSHRTGGRLPVVTNTLPAPIPQSVIDRELAQVGSDAKPIRGRMLRRKSIDGMLVGGVSGDATGSGSVGSTSGVIIATAESTSTVGTGLSPARLRKKRPSEEALNISGTYVNLLIDDEESPQPPQPPSSVPMTAERKKSKQKHRKVSAPSMVTSSMMNATSTPLAAGGNSRPEVVKRSISMIESHDQRTPEKEHNGRIEELPYLEDNDEFIIPTASDLSYDEFMPIVNASPHENERTMNGSGPPSLRSTDAGDVTDGQEPKKVPPKASRRLSSPAFFKTSLLRSSLGSRKRSSKKSPNSGGGSNNTSGHSSSSNSSNISSNVPLDGVQSESSRRPLDGGWHLWWSDSNRVPSSPPSSSQEVSSPADVSKKRQRLGKAKSASPVEDGHKEQQPPVKLSVSFNGDTPANGGSAISGDNGLERKTSRGSIRRLFRKVF